MSSSVTKEFKIIELDDFEPELVPPKKAAGILGSGTTSRRQKTKDGTTAIIPSV